MKPNNVDHTKYIGIDINQVDLDMKALLTRKLESVGAELMEVMNLIKQVSRKERQIKGRIAEMKLQSAGQSELLSNPELLKLVEV